MRRLKTARFLRANLTERLIDIKRILKKFLVINVVSYHTQLPVVHEYLYKSPVYLPIRSLGFC